MNFINEKIRSIRKSRDWSQEEMAEKLSMSVHGYGKIERGETKPNILKLRKIAEVLNVDLLKLLLSNGNNNSYNDANSGSSREVTFEMEILKMEISHKDEVIFLQKREIAHLEHIVEVIESRRSQR